MSNGASHQPRGASRVPHRFLMLTTLAGALVLAGCAVVPEPLSRDEISGTVKADRVTARQDVPALAGPLSLDEAIARGLKYNLEQRTRLMEQGLAVGQFELGRYDLLPKLVAGAGYYARDKENISRSTDSVTGLPSLANPYISSDRSFSTYDLTLSWNVLDFGLSYYNAKQNADRVLIANERRRKAMHVLMQDIRTAYWRAASAQKLEGQLKDTIAMAEGALTDSRKVEAEKLRNPMDSLRYQRGLLETLRVLEGIQRELSVSRIELAGLVNIDPSSAFTIAEPEGAALSPPPLELPTERMEELAVANNADLREQIYTARMAVLDTKKAMLKLFPNLNFMAGPKYNDNSYLINNNWSEVSAQVSWNLFSLFSAPATKRLAEGTEELARQRRVAMQMAVLTQAYLAREQFAAAWFQLQRADAIWKIDASIEQHSVNRESAELQTRLERVSNNTSAIVSLLRRYQALSQVYAASSKVQATLGLEPTVASVQDTPLADLTAQVGAAQARWMRGDFDASKQ